MKYLITESQLDRAIFKYLDNQDFIQIEKNDGTYFVNSEWDAYAQIRYFKEDVKCAIYVGLIDEISSFFSMEVYDVRETIGRWVGETLNVNVKACWWIHKDTSIFLKIPRK